MFQGLRTGSLIYMLDKSEKPKLRIGKVTSISNPQPKYNTYSSFNQPLETFVDVTAKVDEEEITLKDLPSNQTVTEWNRIVVSDNREAMCAEVESMLQNSRMVIDSIPYHNDVIASCDDILKDINPQFAKDKAQEERINGLEERIGNIDTNMSQMMRMLSKALDSSKSK